MEKLIIISESKLTQVLIDFAGMTKDYKADIIAKIKDSSQVVVDLPGVMELFKSFQDTGLNHDVDELEKIFPEIINWPKEKQAEYADNVTISNADKRTFLEMQIGDKAYDEDFTKNLNATSIGNLAYVALNSPAPYNMTATRLLSNLKKFYRSQN